MTAGRFGTLAALASFALAGAVASAQELGTSPPETATSSDDRPAVFAMAEAGEDFEIIVGHSMLLQAEEPFGTVIVGDDTIATATVGAGNSIILTGLTAGSTNLIVLTEEDDMLMASKVAVVPVTGRLRSTITVTKGSEIGEQYECRGNACKLVRAEGVTTEIPLMLMAAPEATSAPAPFAD